MKHKVLVVEDERRINNLITSILQASDYATITAFTAAEAFSLISSHCPDIIVLDLNLPDMDGANIIRSVREWTYKPIIIVSARTQEQDIVEALDNGADDYIKKPFGASELLARIRTAIRHTRTQDATEAVAQSGIFKAYELMIDYNKCQVYLSGQNVHLTQNEYKIIALLAKYAGRVVTYDSIIKELWGPGDKADNLILRVNMANIRRKIERNPAEPCYIFTEVGIGYRMVSGD